MPNTLSEIIKALISRKSHSILEKTAEKAGKIDLADASIELLKNYGPQLYQLIEKSNQDLAKLDNIAQDLHLSTPELYITNEAVKQIGGNDNEVTNLYRNLEKLNDGDPKNKKNIEDIEKYTGIKNPINAQGFVDSDFLRELSASTVFPKLPQEDKNKLYAILGINHGDGLSRLLQKRGQLNEAVASMSKFTPTTAQIQNAHKKTAEYADTESELQQAAKIFSTDSAEIKEKSEDFLIAGGEVLAVTAGATPPKFLSPNRAAPTFTTAGKALAIISGTVPPNFLPVTPNDDIPQEKAESPHIDPSVSLDNLYTYSEALNKVKFTPVKTPSQIQNFAREVEQARKSVLMERSHQIDYFQTLHQKEKQGLGTHPLSLSFGNINVTTQKDDNPFAFAEAVKEVVADERLKVIASTSPFR